ncbi:acyl carrier protein [Methylorubrum sp. Q1]|uniref:acyl carrier protein n=1 Tax=Methylorubrum sp. Q1 TaxID=2562453 RepID=UPI001076075E|nr:acyl carrier protein [Methylorubrum sp. Q1]TFZ58138.1 acyl carrier protein [Methylorubrum sp. Q1]
MSGFYEELAEILEVEPDQMTADLRLENTSWDSLAVVSTIALIDEQYDRAVNATALAACETVGDIERLIAAHPTESEA